MNCLRQLLLPTIVAIVSLVRPCGLIAGGDDRKPASARMAAPATTAPVTTPAATRAGNELLRVAAEKEREPFDPTESYDVRTIEGWKVRVNQRLLRDEPELAAGVLALLQNHLYQATREVPAPALAKIRTVTLWVELDDPMVVAACYHPDAGWLRGHGLNPEKHRCVELGNARRYLEWAHQQPWLVLHELAHAYHHQFLPGGFENPEIVAAYKAAKEGKLYDSVLRNNGKTEAAYAMTNQMEYFAECSEAFFGTNDFYPFVRAELKAHDPQGFAALTHTWGTRKSTPPATQPAAATRSVNGEAE